jgi:hypothetical protein
MVCSFVAVAVASFVSSKVQRSNVQIDKIK